MITETSSCSKNAIEAVGAFIEAIGDKKPKEQGEK